VATRWTSDGVVLDLGAPRLVAAVGFEPSEEPWVWAPMVSVSADGVAWRPIAATASLADATLALLRDPRHGRGEVAFGPVTARLVRLPVALPARPGTLTVR
jgi:hypothetical protein